MARSGKLDRAATVALKEVLALREGEEVLIATNPDKEAFAVAMAYYEAALEAGGKPTIMASQARDRLALADRLTLEAMKALPDVFLGVWLKMAGQDPVGTTIGYVGRDGKKYESLAFKQTWGDRRMRGFFSALTTRDLVQRLVPIDYAALRRRAGALKAILDRGEEIRVTSPAGTDVRVSIAGRAALLDDGDLTVPGKMANLPCGETYISPALGGTEGTVVFDGSITLLDRSVVPRVPVHVTFRDGFVQSVTGGPVAKELLAAIRQGERMARDLGLGAEEKNARHLGEFGIGLNPNARPTANLMEAEKAWRTVHFAIGANFDNDAPALIHQDCLVLGPSLWVDGRQIMRDGDLLL
ncbi:MAG TPA: leucyl aminopeptidase [Methanocella sp.]|nr:leucyl aminopeptidase [Methanocella sp.]